MASLSRCMAMCCMSRCPAAVFPSVWELLATASGAHVTLQPCSCMLCTHTRICWQLDAPFYVLYWGVKNCLHEQQICIAQSPMLHPPTARCKSPRWAVLLCMRRHLWFLSYCSACRACMYSCMHARHIARVCGRVCPYCCAAGGWQDAGGAAGPHPALQLHAA